MPKKKLIDTPAPPPSLSPESAAAWPGLCRDIAAVQGGLCDVDCRMLEAVLRTEDRLAEVQHVIDREGVIVPGSQGQRRPNGLLALEVSLRSQVAQGYERLELSPTKRYRVEAGADHRLERIV